MIDFEAELTAILNDDPLGILTPKPKVSSVMNADNRLKASFEEINQFVTVYGHAPQKSRDIKERRLFSRLQSLRENPDKAAVLLDFDEHNLLPKAVVIETVNDILATDPLGLLTDISHPDVDTPNIFDLSHLPSKSRASTDFMAKRESCQDFDRYTAQFIQVQKEIKTGQRKLVAFTGKGEQLVANNYYILGGILLFLDNIAITSESAIVEGKRFRKDGRTRCIFENGTESNMKYRSLEKALYKEGKTVTQTEAEINAPYVKHEDEINAEDISSGFIYVLSSLSPKPDIQQFEHLYKVGFSTQAIQKRIANADNESTYLMSPVRIVAEYETFNLNAQKFEHCLHRFFAEVCLDLEVADNKGKMHKPHEWFIAPLTVIDQAIQHIINGQIQHYQYDSGLKSIRIK